MSYNNSKENIKKEISNEDLKIEYVQKNAFMEAWFPHAELTVPQFMEQIFYETIDTGIMVTDEGVKNGEGNGKMLIYSPSRSRKKYKRGPFKKIRIPFYLTSENIYDLNIDGFNGVLLSTNLHYGLKKKRLAFFLNFDIDFDGIYTMQHLCKLIHMIEENKILRPTLLVSTGTGVHLIYRLKKPLYVFKDEFSQTTLKAVKSALCSKLEEVYFPNNSFAGKIKPLALDQNIRCVGSTTKLGEMSTSLEEAKKQVVKVWKIGESLTLNEIVEYSKDKLEVAKYVIAKHLEFQGNFFDVSREELMNTIEDDLSQKLMAEMSNSSTTAEENNYNPHIKKKLNYRNKTYRFASKNNYYHWLKLYNNIVEGHRYYYLLGIATWAIKCNIKFKELNKDLKEAKSFFNKRDKTKITNDDLSCVIEAFFFDRFLYALTNKEIYKRCGLTPPVPPKRNYKSRKEHLESIKGLGGRKSKKDEVLSFLIKARNEGIEFQTLTTREIAEISNIPQRTVARHLKECFELLNTIKT